jgi:hypothetical protein
MPAFISPLDGNYISLKRAALLITSEQPGIEPDDIMELFKHAIFTGEFEHRECGIQGIDPNEDRNLPLLRIEAPPGNGLVPRLPPDAQPQEYFAVKGATVAEILSERDALPGSAADWTAFAQFPRRAGVMSETLHALAHIPYSAFPPKAHVILGDILLAKRKLHAWMIFKGYDLPDFLKDITVSAAKEGGVAKSAEIRADALATDALRGRPRKSGWRRVEELIREMHAAHPDSPRSVLAYDAHKIAATEFDEKDLPSLETVTRQMKTILGPEG